MNTSTIIVLTVIVGIAGTFAKNPGDVQKAVRVMVALGAYAFGALLLEYVDVQLSEQLAVLILVAMLFVYGVPISQKLNTFWKAA